MVRKTPYQTKKKVNNEGEEGREGETIILAKHPACNGARIRNKITTINREMGVTYFG